MKALIWIASILITSIVAVIIKAAGVTLGAIPTMILYAPMFFITPKLCKKWHERKAKKEWQKTVLSEYPKNDPSHVLNLDKETDFKERFSKAKAKQNSPIIAVSEEGHTEMMALQRENPSLFENLNRARIISKNTSSPNVSQACLVTSFFDLSNYYGRFVKIQIDELENPDTFYVRTGNTYRPISQEKNAIVLSKAITKLEYSTLRGTTSVRIEAISPIRASEYEDKHYIFGILRRNEKERYILTNAFVFPSESNLRLVKKQLEEQEAFEYSVLEDGTVSIFNLATSSSVDLIIPESINGKKVTAISVRAFERNNEIKTVEIPSTVKTIGTCAFQECKGIERVNIGDGVEELDLVFDVCEKLKKVHLGKSVSRIQSSFHNCHNITGFDVDPDNNFICTIDGVIFSKDKSVLIFCPCGKTGKYDIPYGTKVIGDSAFENTDLEEIYIPNTVEKIGFDAFSWASGIKKINIPSSVIDIEYDAFSAGIGDFEAEIVIEEGSYAQQYFDECYPDGDTYRLTIVGPKDQIQLLKSIPTTNITNDSPIEIDENLQTIIKNAFGTSKTEKTNNEDSSNRLFCRHCGQQLPLDSEFCYKCGTKVEKIVVSANIVKNPFDDLSEERFGKYIKFVSNTDIISENDFFGFNHFEHRLTDDSYMNGCFVFIIDNSCQIQAVGNRCFNLVEYGYGRGNSTPSVVLQISLAQFEDIAIWENVIKNRKQDNRIIDLYSLEEIKIYGRLETTTDSRIESHFILKDAFLKFDSGKVQQLYGARKHYNCIAEKLNDNEVGLDRCVVDNEDFSIPSNINKYTVTKISNAAFCDNRYIKTILIPDSIKQVDSQIFYSCQRLRKITAPSRLHSFKNQLINCYSQKSIEYIEY